MNQPSQISPTISQLTTTFPQSQIRPPNNTIQYPKPSLIPLHPWNPQQEETNSRVFPRSIITQSVHSTKTSTSPSQIHGKLRGMRFTGGGGSSRAYGQRACYNKTIPCCNSQGAKGKCGGRNGGRGGGSHGI